MGEVRAACDVYRKSTGSDVGGGGAGEYDWEVEGTGGGGGGVLVGGGGSWGVSDACGGDWGGCWKVFGVGRFPLSPCFLSLFLFFLALLEVRERVHRDSERMGEHG